jgi:hypothetical protein
MRITILPSTVTEWQRIGNKIEAALAFGRRNKVTLLFRSLVL